MRAINRPNHNLTVDSLSIDDPGRSLPRDDQSPSRRLRPQLLADAVIAGYIHDISMRHHDGVAAEDTPEFSELAEAA